jgi:hypothetical protein
VPGWWIFPVVQLILLGLLIAQDPGRIDRRSPALGPTGLAPGLPGLPLPGLHQRHRVQPHRHLPVRRWAKLTMMVQSALSLVIAILVIARAINVLPGWKPIWAATPS